MALPIATLYPTVANAVRRPFGRSLGQATAVTGAAMRVVAAAAVIAASAQVCVRLGNTPVPFTLQSMAVLWVAALLGGRGGVAAVCTYLAAGALGLPVFSGGRGGVMHLVGPWAGFLFGFVPAAALVGWSQHRHVLLRVACWAGAVGVIWSLGVLTLAAWLGLPTAWRVGCVSFATSDILKAVAAWCAAAVWRRGRWAPGATVP